MSTTLKRREIFIGGKWGPGTGSEYQDIVNPATGKVIAEVPNGTEEAVNTAVRPARDASDDVWFHTTPRQPDERRAWPSWTRPDYRLEFSTSSAVTASRWAPRWSATRVSRWFRSQVTSPPARSSRAMRRRR